MNSSEELFPVFNSAGQMVIFWRILHLITGTYGNYPAGQLLIALTMVFLHQRGMNPTLSDLCKATGLPKATVSRYVSWQLKEGLAEEIIDPNDRRRRILLQTDKGRAAWRWQAEQLRKLFREVHEWDVPDFGTGSGVDPEVILAAMKRLTADVRLLEHPYDPSVKEA